MFTLTCLAKDGDIQKIVHKITKQLSNKLFLVYIHRRRIERKKKKQYKRSLSADHSPGNAGRSTTTFNNCTNKFYLQIIH